MITRAAQQHRADDAVTESDRLEPLWSLFGEFSGSLRVIAAIAEQLSLAAPRCLPLPLQGLGAADRIRVAAVVDELSLV